VTEHEQDEIKETLSALLELKSPDPYLSLSGEADRHKYEFGSLKQRYGKTAVQSSLEKVHQVATTKPNIPRYVLLFWLAFHLMTRSSQYDDFSVAMPDVMLSDTHRQHFRTIIADVLKEYGRHEPPIVEYMKLRWSVDHLTPPEW
jgi:hypothetical protein